MKHKAYFIIPILITLITFVNFNKITDKISTIFKHEPTVIISTPNKYQRLNNYKYVQLSDNFIPYSKQDIKNIFYSILNNGYETFTFYCPSQYEECLEDVHTLSLDKKILTHINNFVNPFNNFNTIKVSYDESGEVNIKVIKAYTKEEVIEIENKVNSIINEVISDDMSLDDKILKIHDYIINITVYDQARLDGHISYKSNIAYGPLIEGYAICGGYADAMALFLNKFGVPNFKVASETHVWNAVYLNDRWLHLDLTWDDPVSDDGANNLIHKFYLIDSDTLDEYKINDHDYDKTVYREL